MEVPRLERKLVAILAADIAGYSRHMERDEVATLTRLSAHRVITDALIERYQGRITGTAGDSVLAEFASVVDAVDCAVEIQRAIEASSHETPPGDQLLFRIGVNVGDVMVKDDDIFGDGVNVAARLESLADPGGICVSRGVRDHLRKHSTFVFEDIGEQSVKNIAQAIRAFRVHFDGREATQVDAHDDASRKALAAQAQSSADNGPATEIELAFWESVKDSEDGSELEAYLERYPDGVFAPLAQTRRNALVDPERGDADSGVPTVAVELAFWDSVKDSSSATELRAYLDQYPTGGFAALARARLDALSESDPKTEPNAASAAETIAVELAFWDSVKDSENPAILEAYLGQYPDGSFATLAKVRLAELAAETGKPDDRRR